jgi:hypothetical protein
MADLNKKYEGQSTSFSFLKYTVYFYMIFFSILMQEFIKNKIKLTHYF